MPSPRLRALPLLSLGLVAVVLVWAVRLPAVTWKSAQPPRHVILISLDTLRADHLGAWGYEGETSPRLDSLAKKSVVFRRAVAQGSSTIPSHASLFTSQYASAVIAPGAGLLDWSETLAEALSLDGFATWGFVDGGNVRSRFGFDRGFEHYEDDRVGVERLVARAKGWITSHPTPRFFLFLHTYEIHTPYKAPPEYVKMFGTPEFRPGFHPDTKYFREIEAQGKGLSAREHREVVARYDAGIRYTDERIGGFLDWLDERGLLQDSLVVVVSDHGEEFLEHGRLGHQQLYLDPNLRVPLLFYRRGMPARVIDETVELIDVVPTILDLLELPNLPASVGQSLVASFAGVPPRGDRMAYAEKGTMPGAQTVITDRYQLLEDRTTNEVRLYDLQADPEATRDVLAEQPAVAAELAAAMAARREAASESWHRHEREARRQTRIAPMKDKVRRELEVLGYLE